VVVAITSDVAASGVSIGMKRRQAEALCPTVVTLVSDPGAEAVAFEPVARTIEEVVPRLEMASPGLVYVPVAGAVRYYGTEHALVGRVVAAVDQVAQPGGKIGLADGPFAARMAAERATAEPLIVTDTAAFLARVEVSALGVEELVDTFRWLGIVTLGELASLPRAAVASRFGTAGLEAHYIASGEDRVVRPRRVDDPVLV
jgi:protein ImuB